MSMNSVFNVRNIIENFKRFANCYVLTKIFAKIKFGINNDNDCWDNRFLYRK